MRHGFDDQHARHDRAGGKMALEMRLTGRNILDADRAGIGNHIDDLVHHQERIAVGNHLHDAVDVDDLAGHIFGGRHPRNPLCLN